MLRRNARITLTFLSLLVLGFSWSSVIVGAQGSDATPTATPADEAALQFRLVPVGDHPEGYFRDVEVKPGSSVDLQVGVVNSGTIPVELRTYKVNALSGVNGGYVSGEEDDLPIGSAAWIDYPTTTLALEPQTQQVIAFSVSVPADAKPGQYISGLVVETAEALPVPGTESLEQVIGYAISIGILIPGEMKGSFELGTAALAEEGPVRRLQIPLTNTGNVLVQPKGAITLTNSSGNQVLSSPLELRSVYAGLSTVVETVLPDQMPSGDYVLDLSLKDDASGSSDEIVDARITIPEPKDPSGLYVETVTIESNADPIVFANVAVTLDNGGQQLPATNVTLHVLHDGEEVEQFPLATNQVLPNGQTQLTARYLPAEMWETGTYSFKIVVTAVDPNGGQETVLTTHEVEQTIQVP